MRRSAKTGCKVGQSYRKHHNDQNRDGHETVEMKLPHMEAIIFCGIQATGKSTFYVERFFNSHVRISLDLLCTRYRENLFLHACLESQQPFVIDNTNVTKAERAKYVTHAKTAKYQVICYYFQSKIADALERNAKRIGKTKIPVPGVKGTFNRLEIPTIDEGFDQMYYVEITNMGFQVNGWQDEI